MSEPEKPKESKAAELSGGFFDGLLIVFVACVIGFVAYTGTKAFEPTITRLLQQQEEAKKWGF